MTFDELDYAEYVQAREHYIEAKALREELNDPDLPDLPPFDPFGTHCTAVSTAAF